jgi:uncharacterized protein (DUF849 family)
LAPSCLRILIEPHEQELAKARSLAGQILPRLTVAGVNLPSLLLRGCDNTAWSLFEDAALLGHQMRIGLEDTLALPNGEVARDNADLVTEAQRCLAWLTRQQDQKAMQLE